MCNMASSVLKNGNEIGSFLVYGRRVPFYVSALISAHLQISVTVVGGTEIALALAGTTKRHTRECNSTLR